MYGNCGFLNSDIYFWQPGSYFVTINIHHIEQCQIYLLKNNSLVTGSNSFFSLINNQNSNHFIINITETDITETYSSSPSGLACKINLNINSLGNVGININDPSELNLTIPTTYASMSFLLLNQI